MPDEPSAHRTPARLGLPEPLWRTLEGPLIESLTEWTSKRKCIECQNRRLRV